MRTVRIPKPSSESSETSLSGVVLMLLVKYIDHASGKTQERENYKRLLEDTRRRRLDVVLVWRYDRFARSTVALVNALTEFRSLGVDFISLQENVDTTTPQGELIFSIMASPAQFESSLISARIPKDTQRPAASIPPTMPLSTRARFTPPRELPMEVR